MAMGGRLHTSDGSDWALTLFGNVQEFRSTFTTQAADRNSIHRMTTAQRDLLLSTPGGNQASERSPKERPKMTRVGLNFGIAS